MFQEKFQSSVTFDFRSLNDIHAIKVFILKFFQTKEK